MKSNPPDETDNAVDHLIEEEEDDLELFISDGDESPLSANSPKLPDEDDPNADQETISHEITLTDGVSITAATEVFFLNNTS
jgi:hypothetical protein